MRELIYYIATSLDGYIAHEDGSFDGFAWDDVFVADIFENFPETIPDHLHTTETKPFENKWFDVVLMGRATYTVGLDQGITNPYPGMRQYVFSRTMTASPDPMVTLVSENAVATVTALKQESGKAIWLCGGAKLAADLYTASLIDRLIIKLNPVLFGSGIPLFAGNVDQTALKLTDSKVYPSGHVMLFYNVQ